MDNDGNTTGVGTTGSAEPIGGSTPEVGQNSDVGVIYQPHHNIFTQYPALKLVAGVAAIALFIGGVSYFKNSDRLEGLGADASCYGYNCEPFVSLGGREFISGYNNNPFSYGTLIMRSGARAELTWFGVNVDNCKADWTKFQGTYLPPTLYGPVTQSQRFEVTCYRGRQKVTANLNVRVINRAPSDLELR